MPDPFGLFSTFSKTSSVWKTLYLCSFCLPWLYRFNCSAWAYSYSSRRESYWWWPWTSGNRPPQYLSTWTSVQRNKAFVKGSWHVLPWTYVVQAKTSSPDRLGCIEYAWLRVLLWYCRLQWWSFRQLWELYLYLIGDAKILLDPFPIPSDVSGLDNSGFRFYGETSLSSSLAAATSKNSGREPRVVLLLATHVLAPQILMGFVAGVWNRLGDIEILEERLIPGAVKIGRGSS